MTCAINALKGGYILWIGSVLRDEDSVSNPAASPAASRWQRELLRALSVFDGGTVMLSHLPQRLWPRGRLFPRKPEFPPETTVETFWISYCNCPFFRSRSIAKAMVRETRGLVKRRGPPLAVITYNPTPENIEFGRFCQNALGIRWVDLCADAEEPGRDWSLYPSGAGNAWGHVFLSSFAFENGPFTRKLHLDGGISWCGGEKPIAPVSRSLLYTGMMSKWGGIDPLLGAFARIPDPKAELWIAGHGENPAVMRACSEDSRIRFLGMLPAKELQEAYRRASVFVNPRPANVPGNSMNFPSKLLQYLAYGKPVVSTLTPGVSDEYRAVVIEAPSDDEAVLAQKLQFALGMSDTERRCHWDRAKKFAEHRTWNIQAMRLVDWISNAHS